MKVKAKIVSTILSMVLALGVMGFAVYAAATQTLIVNNTVSFVSKHVLARVTGHVDGAHAGDDIVLSYGTEETGPNDSQLAPWQITENDATLVFQDENKPINIFIMLQNYSLERMFTFEIKFEQSNLANETNINRNVSFFDAYETSEKTLTDYVVDYNAGNSQVVLNTYTNAVEVAKDTTKVVVITLEIDDTGKSVFGFNNNFEVTLRNEGELEPQEPVEGGEFSFNPSNKTIFLPAGKTISYETMPDMSGAEGRAFYGLYKPTDTNFENKLPMPYTATNDETVVARLEEILEGFIFTRVMDGWAVGYQNSSAPKILGKLEIPTLLDGLPITQIKNNAFSWQDYVTEIEISDLVHDIGSSAFPYASYQNLPYENGVLYLGKVAFQFDGTTIENGTVTLRDDTIGLAADIFINQRTITNITLPPNLKTIGAGAFRGPLLQSITIPKSVEKIGSSAFNSYQSVLSEVVMEDEAESKLHTIGSGAFGNAPWNPSPWYEGLSNGLHYLGKVAYCYKGVIDNDVNEPFQLRSNTIGIAGNFVDQGSLLRSIEIPDSVIIINESAFNRAIDLESASLSKETSQLKVIEHDAFGWIENFKNITFPDSLISIGEFAFDASGLEEIKIPANIITIEPWAFSECDSLRKVEIEEGITEIGEWVFTDSAISELILPESLEIIGEGAFRDNHNLNSISLGKNIKYVGEEAFGCCWSLTSIQVHPENEIYKSEDGVLYNSDKTILLQYPSGRNNEYFEVPVSVKHIANHAFQENNFIKNIVLPNGLISIGNFTFYHCISLENINLPNTLTSIGDAAFGGYVTNALKSIIIPSSVTMVGNSAFSGSGLATIYVSSSTSGWSAYWNGWGDRPVYLYSETQPEAAGNYWHYVDGVVTIW